MTIKEIRDQFLAQYNIQCLIGGLKKIELVDKMIAYFISEAQQDIQRRLSVIIGTYTISTLNGTTLYNCPEDFGGLRFAMCGDDPVNIESERTILTKQYPRGYLKQIAVYTAGDTPQILVQPTPSGVEEINIYYAVNTGFYQPSGATDQVWGAYDGETFTGKLLLPNDYLKAVILYMMMQFFPDYEAKYEKEILSLKGSIASSSPMKLDYEFGYPKKRYYKVSPTGDNTIVSPTSTNRTYQVSIAQSGTSAPIIINTFANTFTGTPVFARTGVGVYTITLASAFTTDKTFLFNPNIDIASVGDETTAELEWTSENVITLRVFDSVNDPTDGFNAVYIKIEVEP